MTCNEPKVILLKTFLILLLLIQIFSATSYAQIVFSETFEGDFPESNGWTVGDDNFVSGGDSWDTTDYQKYSGLWSGWSAQYGNQSATKTVTETIFLDNFEETWPGSWTVEDKNVLGDQDYWGRSTYRICESCGNYSVWVAEKGSSWGIPNTVWHEYDNYMEAYMTRSIPMDLRSYDYVILTYDYWLISEYGYDKLYVKYKDESGWITVDEKSGEYNNGKWGASGWYIPTTATEIRFLFISDGSDTYEGAYVDNIKLVGTKTIQTEVQNSQLHQYDDYMDSYMLKLINLAGHTSATLSYDYWLDVEYYFDRLKVQTSSDGNNWVTLRDYSEGYDSKQSGGYARQWRSDHIDLKPFAGSTAYLKFLFKSDDSVHDREGAYLDNIKVEAPSPQPAVSLSGVPVQVKMNQAFTININLQNNGGFSNDGGVHLLFDDMQVVSVSNGKFNSNSFGSNYAEFYGQVLTGSPKTAQVTLKATGKNARIYYRGWLMTPEQEYCSVTGLYQNKNYRDPGDVQCRANFMDYSTKMESLVVQYYSAAIAPSSQSKTVSVGTQAVYSFTITNTGNLAETFNLATTRGTLSTSSIYLNAGASSTFTLMDISYVPGTLTATITATSRTDPAIRSTSTAVSTFIYMPDLSILPEDITFEKPGGS